MTMQIDISKMKVKDLKDRLVKDHGYEISDLIANEMIVFVNFLDLYFDYLLN